MRIRSLLAIAVLLLGNLAGAAPRNTPVSIVEDATTFTLSNGMLTARGRKASGDLISLIYKGTETLTGGSGHAFGYWSHDTTGGVGLQTRVSIDPQANAGARGEVSIKAISGGRRMGHGPGAPPGGDFPADIEIRYTLARGTAMEFTHAPRFFEPGIQLRYAEQFPRDVHFTIGRSQPAHDWFFAHVPHHVEGNAAVVPFRGVQGAGLATPYTIVFEAKRQFEGRATLRLAICGTGAKHLDIAVNDKHAGRIELGPEDGVITRHQIQGLWYERELAFDAAMLQPGANA